MGELAAGTLCQVIKNDEGQYSVWPAGNAIPSGWQMIERERTKEECLRHIDEAWADMRPATLRQAAEPSAIEGTTPRPQRVPDNRIERSATLAPEVFVRDHLVASRPVIVTGEMRDWNLSRFTPAALRAAFGHCEVPVYDELFSLQYLESLDVYLDQCFGRASTDPCKQYVRWYARFREGDFAWADDAFDALRADWRIPSFLPRDSYLLPYRPAGEPIDTSTRFPFEGLFISGRGTRTRLHVDPLASSAMLCQLHGTKRVTLYRPGSDTSAAPTFDDALNPGDILFIPDGWPHEAEGLSDSVSLTWNFVHASKAGGLIAQLAGKADLDHLDTVRHFTGEPSRAAPELADLFARRLATLSAAVA